MSKTIAPDPGLWRSEQSLSEELEQRVARLEDAVAALCDAEAWQDRLQPLVQKEIARLRQELQAAITAASARPAQEPSKKKADATVTPTRPFAFFREIWNDVTTFFRLIRDPAYRLSFPGKIIPVAALAYVLWPFDIIPEPSLSWFPSGIPIFGLVDDIFVTYIGLKFLGRELRRYRDHVSKSK